jgi:hypothetical protein
LWIRPGEGAIGSPKNNTVEISAPCPNNPIEYALELSYGPRTTSALRDFGLLLIRGIIAAVLMFHGSQKLFGWFEGPGIDGFTKTLVDMEKIPQPEVAAYLSAGTEFVGGLLLLVGFFDAAGGNSRGVQYVCGRHRRSWQRV